MKHLALAILASLSLAATAAPFKVGSMGGQEADLVKAAAKVAKEKHGLDVEVVEFDDYVMPNVALADGSIDANAFQHKPYLNVMVKERGLDLVPVGNTFVYPIGAYSKKIKSIDELKDGATIALPGDPSNGGRSLILLDKKGFIKLKDNTNLESGVIDIAENPRNFKFSEVDAAQVPNVLPDVDLAFINSNYAINADLLPKRDALIMEDVDSPYVNIIAVRSADKDKEEVKKFVDAYHSKEVEEAAEKVFKGAAVKGW
ncbi:MAG: MetQ/NlpA family ABC transporter substrate-binding protein [Cardiobacteriaceae bacterium]|nr:MetQ/NlpA family ABC transporter substrate-binding protein [Cardiobacteriaceae bacterium]